ncbi:MAG TPA: hypothetical protein VND95_00105 [Stellaceae bacterium]|nr:hypothetical protein [Stellaceae bacterium]
MADAADALHRLQLSCVEPLIIATRKRRRLAAFGIASPERLACADLALMADSGACVPPCSALIAAERRYLARYLGGGGASFIPPRWRGVPAVIELDRYPDFASYADRVRRHSKGGVLRQVRRARAQGFFCKRIHRDFYRRQVFAIDTSKRFRSGLVLKSLVRRQPASDLPADISPAEIAAYLGRPAVRIADGAPLPEPPSPVCAQHWNIDWGMFQCEDTGSAPRERLVGYLFLRRAGNIVRTVGLMGHGDYLAQNVMKLLFHDIMQWLLARADPHVVGLRYLLYGAIEHGNDGLLAWKRSFEFAPLRFAVRE